MGLKKDERIQKIKACPPDTIFVVRVPNDMFWKWDDYGYSEHIDEAKKFTRNEILDRLNMNELMDKTIEIYTPTERI